MNSVYDYDRFQAHPIKETDLIITRDIDLFKCILEDYERAVARKIKDYRTNRSLVSKILDGYVATLQKIHSYERKSGMNLISYVDSRGKRRQNPSYFARLAEYL